MSGYCSSCIVCGAFHATGHVGDEWIKLYTEHETPVLVCPKCVPFIPQYDIVQCKECGVFTGVEIWPKGTWGCDHGWNEYICPECLKAKDDIEAERREYQRLKRKYEGEKK